MKLDYDLISKVKVARIDMRNYPDFVDAYIKSASYDGQPMTDEQLEELNKDVVFIHEAAHRSIF